jgi:two-component system, cell cycle sensor histidine kinase PleC
MRLIRLWRNRSRRAHPAEVSYGRLAVDLENSARANATRFGIKIAATGVTLVLVLWAFIAFDLHGQEQAAIEREQVDGQNLSAAFAEEVTRTFDSIAGAMALVARQVRADPVGFSASFDPTRWSAELAAIARPTVHVLMLDPAGQVMFTTLSADSGVIDAVRRDPTVLGRDRSDPGLRIGTTVQGVPFQPPILPVGRQVATGDGRPLGTLIFFLEPGGLTRLHRSIDLGPSGTLTLIGLDRVVRARFIRNTRDGLPGIGTLIDHGAFPRDLPPGGIGIFVVDGAVDGIRRLFTARRLTSYPLLVSVGIEFDLVLAPAREHRVVIILLGIAATLLLGLLILRLMREMWRRTMREIELAREHGRLEAAHAQILRDRGRLEEANRELIDSTRRAEEASRAKSLFLANMSHELRTPLNAVIGFSELIREQAPTTPDMPPLAEYAADILASGRHLLELINSILDLSKVESGTTQLTETLVPLTDVVHAGLTAIRGQARHRGIALDVTLPQHPPSVRVDLTKMRQVLINLLSNAVKFTQENGKILLAARMLGQGDRLPGGLLVTVTDNGIGMTEDEIAIALEPFGQVDNTLARSVEGTGLGLPLARRLVELHGGRLVIRSVKGEGTTAEVWLPADRVVQATADASTG